MAISDERIVAYRVNQKSRAEEHRDYYEDRWIRNMALYRNTGQTRRFKMQPWQSNAMIPDAFRVVETMLPQHVLGMFRNPQWFSVEAPTVPGQTYQNMVRSLLLQGWRKADGFRRTVEGMKMGTILGHFIPKTTWKQSIGEIVIQDLDVGFAPDGEPIDQAYVERTLPTVTHNGPAIEFPDLFNIWQDPTGAGEFWIERIPTSFSKLEVTNKQFSGNLYQNLAKLKAHMTLNPTPFATNRRGTGGQTDQPLSEVVDGIPEQFDDDSVELWQCWGYVPPTTKKYDDTQWRLQVIANGEVLIRDEPAPTHNHQAPYDNVTSVPIPGQVYGDSVLSYVGDLIELRSEIENRRRDEVLLGIHPPMWFDGRLQIRGQQMVKEPGGALKLTATHPDLPVQNMFGMLPRPPILQEAYRESDVKERQIAQATGIHKTFEGESSGGRTTAFEVGQMMDVGTARIQLATMWMDESFKRPVLGRMFKLYKSKMTQPEIVAITGGEEVRGEIDLSDLKYDVDIFVDSGLFGSMDQITAQSIVQLYTPLLATPEGRATVNFTKFARVLNYRLGLSGGSDDFIRSEEEAQAIIQQQQAAEAAAAGGGAGGGQGGAGV